MADSPTQQAILSAPPTADPSKGRVPSRVCLISMGGELFALDLRYVREVFEVESFTPVPGMPPTLTGVANLRGTVIPLADLRPALGLSSEGAPKYAVVVRNMNQQMAVLVDEVPEIRTVRPEEVLAPPSKDSSSGNRPFVSAILTVEGRMSGMVEVSTLLSCVEAA